MCEHTDHLHCNICGGAVCRKCYGAIAPTAQLKYGPSQSSNYESEELLLFRKALSRRVKVENILIEHFSKKTSPTPQECFELAKMLGIPEEHRNDKV